MNKKNVETYFEYAYISVSNAINAGVIKTTEVGKYRSQISSFGAAISMGSLKAAILFYSVKGKADIDRAVLLNLIYRTLRKIETVDIPSIDVKAENVKFFNEIQENKYSKQDIIEAAIAVKLVFNLFIAEDKQKEEK